MLMFLVGVSVGFSIAGVIYGYLFERAIDANTFQLRSILAQLDVLEQRKCGVVLTVLAPERQLDPLRPRADLGRFN